MTKQIIFFGSSAYSIPSLQTLLDHQVTVSGVITTEDKPAGRHLKLTPNPLKQFATEKDLKIIDNCQLTTVNSDSVGLVAAYGKIIPQSVLNTFNNQIFNIHPSLLPKYRGPSPLQFQIIDGQKETGVTVIQLDAKMDHGPIVAQEKDIILDTDTPETLGKRLFIKGTELFLSTPLFLSPSLGERTEVRGTLQDDSQATYTRKLTRQDGFVPYDEYQKFLRLGSCDLDLPHMARAFAGWPGLWTIDPSDTRIKIKLP
jgi:methionyl-tRNA formyltransferase